MNRVSYVPYLVREARDATKFNTIQTGYETAATQLDSTNFAEEGLDRAALASTQPSTATLFYIAESTRAAAAIGATPWIQVNFGAPTAFRWTPAVPPYALAAGDVLRIRARVWYSTAVGAGQHGVTDDVHTRVVYQPNGGGATPITNSVRSCRVMGAGASVYHAVVSTLTWLDGPLSLDWVELQHQTLIGGSQIWPSKATFDGILFKRVT